MHRAGIAHRDPSARPSWSTATGLPWIVDFSRAEAAANAGHRRKDVADLVTLVGADGGDTLLLGTGAFPVAGDVLVR